MTDRIDISFYTDMYWFIRDSHLFMSKDIDTLVKYRKNITTRKREIEDTALNVFVEKVEGQPEVDQISDWCIVEVSGLGVAALSQSRSLDGFDGAFKPVKSDQYRVESESPARSGWSNEWPPTQHKIVWTRGSLQWCEGYIAGSREHDPWPADAMYIVKEE